MSAEDAAAVDAAASAPPEVEADVEFPTAQYVHAATPAARHGVARVWGVTL